MTHEKQLMKRKELFSLLGRLPDRNLPFTCRLITLEERKDYVLEKLLLEFRDSDTLDVFCESIPAYFTHPYNSGPYPAVLFCHSHGGMYYLGKDELLDACPYMYKPSYAVELAKRGIAALAIDHWCFGERSGRSETSTFKHMLWDGEVMWGHMVYDSLRALDYLCSRNDVNPQRIASLGMSMGSTMSWWTAALDERIQVCIDICCLSDYDEIIRKDDLDLHGIYYYVPNLHRCFSSAQINELIAPRPHLGLVGTYDGLTPVHGVTRIEQEVQKVYTECGATDSFSIHRYPVGHRETAAMRADILAFLDKYL